MKKQDIQVGGEFIFMASSLIRIKSNMLLPKPDMEEDVKDPRLSLVGRLLEYKRFKEISQKLLMMNIQLLEIKKLL